MAVVIDGTNGITTPDVESSGPVSGTNFSYTGTLTGGTGVVNLGSGQLYKDASGNVGIGTSSPDTGVHLRVFGNAHYTAQFGTGNKARLEANATGASVIGVGAIPITFITDNTERARIDSSGNLLVGTTSARARVTSTNLSGFGPTINGGDWSSKAAIAVSGSFGGGISLVDGTAGYTMYCSDFGNDFYIQGATSLAGTVGGGVFLNDRGTSWSSASDERMKTIIEPITDAVAKVMELRAVIGRYNYEEEHKRHPFLIAQDVKRVLPEAVSVANKLDPVEDQRLAVSYTDTIPLLVAAIKELKAINDAQAQTIESLTARVAALEGQA